MRALFHYLIILMNPSFPIAPNGHLVFGCITSKNCSCNLVHLLIYYRCSKRGTERKETNMEKTFLSISITYYNMKALKPEVHYYRNDGVHPTTSTFDKLTVDEANQLMWEVVRLGGKNSYTANMFNNAISERRVTFWGFL